MNFRLDYCGIALLIMGSFVPWLYYGFYCHYQHKLIYLSVVVVLGCVSIIVSLWDKFSEPNLRPLRAGKCCLLNTIVNFLTSHTLFRFFHVLWTIGSNPGYPLRPDGRMVQQNKPSKFGVACAHG